MLKILPANPEIEDYEFKVAFEEFLSTYTRTSVRTVQELVDFNTEHADLELPDCKFPCPFRQRFSSSELT